LAGHSPKEAGEAYVRREIDPRNQTSLDQRWSEGKRLEELARINQGHTPRKEGVMVWVNRRSSGSRSFVEFSPLKSAITLEITKLKPWIHALYIPPGSPRA